MAEDIRTMHEEDEDEVKYCERKRLLFFGLPWTFTKYTITPSMLTIDQGLLKTEENDCYMYKVQDVKLATTLLERIFGLGTITCYTGDVTNAELKLIHIRKSKEVKNQSGSHPYRRIVKTDDTIYVCGSIAVIPGT